MYQQQKQNVMPMGASQSSRCESEDHNFYPTTNHASQLVFTLLSCMWSLFFVVLFVVDILNVG